MKKLFIVILVCLMVVGMVGCAGKNNYMRPNSNIEINKNDIIINESKRVVWDKLLKKISDEYFVVNNLEYDSGFLDLSFSNNNEKFVDCGCYKIKVLSNKIGNESKCIPILSDDLVGTYLGGVWKFTKNYCVISGRTNILVQEMDENKTKISFNIKYIVNVSKVLWNSWNGRLNFIYFSVGFNSGSYGHSHGIMCKSTGFYENELLKTINSIK